MAPEAGFSVLRSKIMKLCECGCGNPAPIAKKTDNNIGHIKGKPIRFIVGHNLIKRGDQNSQWKGGYNISMGYIYKRESGTGTMKPLSAVIAEKVLGKSLPKGAMVHHIDEDKMNNSKNNLVVCQDRGYHNTLHVRMIALRACGKANFRKCCLCHNYDDPANMLKHARAGMKHRRCENRYRLELRHLRKTTSETRTKR